MRYKCVNCGDEVVKMLVVHSHVYMMEVNAEGQEEGKIVAEKDASEYYCYNCMHYLGDAKLAKKFYSGVELSDEEMSGVFEKVEK